MMSLTFGLFSQVSGSGPLGPLVRLQAQQMAAECIVEIVLINNLGFRVHIVNSGTKYDFNYEKRH